MRRLISLFVTLAITAGMIPFVGQVAGAQSNALSDPADLPALASTAAPPEELTRPTGDFDPAPKNPGPSFDAQTSVAQGDMTTANRKVFKNPDGTYTAQYSAGVARVQDASGTWADIDLTL